MAIDFTKPREPVKARAKLDTSFLVRSTTKMNRALIVEGRKRGLSREELVRRLCEKYLDDPTWL